MDEKTPKKELSNRYKSLRGFLGGILYRIRNRFVARFKKIIFWVKIAINVSKHPTNKGANKH